MTQIIFSYETYVFTRQEICDYVVLISFQVAGRICEGEKVQLSYTVLTISFWFSIQIEFGF